MGLNLAGGGFRQQEPTPMSSTPAGGHAEQLDNKNEAATVSMTKTTAAADFPLVSLVTRAEWKTYATC